MHRVKNKALLDAVWRIHQDHIENGALDGFENALSEVIEELPEGHKGAMDDAFVWWPETGGYNEESNTEYTRLLGWFILSSDFSMEDAVWVLKGCIEDAIKKVGPEEDYDLVVDKEKFFNLLEKSCS